MRSVSASKRRSVRQPWDQPFNNSSIWNTPLGTGAVWSLPTDADTIDLRTPNGNVNSLYYGMPIYVGTSSDPVKTLTSLYNSPPPPQSIHVPAGAHTLDDTDRHLSFFDQTNPTKFWSFWDCTANGDGSGWTCQLGQVDNTCGDGMGDGATMAQGYNNFNWGLGTMRSWELNAGKIEHMLRYTLATTKVKYKPTPEWPQTSQDGFASSSTYTGNVYFGATIGIPQSVDINSLGLSAGGLIVATCLQNYGAMMRDTAGDTFTGGIVLYAEPDMESTTILSQIRGDMNKISPVLCILRNQAPATPNGGGNRVVSGPGRLNLTTCPLA